MTASVMFLKALDDMRAAQRTGIRPIPVHVSLGLAELARRQVLGGGAQQSLPAMMEGIRAYQTHPFRREVKAPEMIWQAGEAKLFRYPAEGAAKGTVFVTPSMINRSVILDLLPEKSFTRWLATRGFDVLLLDWGQPVKDTGMETMDGVIMERLLPAMEYAAKEAGGKIHALGYCMGGTLLAGGAALSPKILRSVIFLASPWDFHAGDRVLASYIQNGVGTAEAMMVQGGFLPAEWIQLVFAAINAERTVTKFAGFAAQGNEAAVRVFVAVEDWLNDGIDLPAGVARTCLHEWYVANAPGRGDWKIDGAKVDVGQIGVPALVVASDRDRLVPAESSLAIVDIMPRAETLTPAIGHIGMMTGRACESEIWERVGKWLK